MISSSTRKDITSEPSMSKKVEPNNCYQFPPKVVDDMGNFETSFLS
jgi:hypothetical protein